MRPSKIETIFDVAMALAKRSTCDRAHVGAVLVNDDGHVLSMGYNGSPKGMPHCDDEGHELINNHCVRTVHAEANALIQAAQHGTNINNATLYSTMFPCYNCAKLIVNAGIKRVVVMNEYHDAARSKILFFAAGVTISKYDKSTSN